MAAVKPYLNYFHAKRPRSYVKAMATRQLNKRLAAF